MRLKISIKPYELIFKRPAGTSRGVLKTRKIWFILIKDQIHPEIAGIGECGPLPGLSVDDIPDFESRLNSSCIQLAESGSIEETDLTALPSVQFAFETALNDLKNGGKREIFKNDFYKGKLPIPINGLIWMNDKETMYAEALSKVASGFNVLKFKVGALDFDEECRMLEAIRKKFTAFNVEIRLDANGAFNSDDALPKLKDLSRFDIHSIEQPVKAGQWDLMAEVCSRSPIDIALDEELIGQPADEKLVKHIKPKYLILKPSLLGGFRITEDWISIARRNETGWWATSALESNIGLNAIAQFTAEYPVSLPQGLGTGGLYENNIDSPLQIKQGKLHYKTTNFWGLHPVSFFPFP